MIQIIGDDNKATAEYLIKNLKIDGQDLSSRDYSIVQLEMFSFQGQHSFENAQCPEGYVLGSLIEKHNQLATSQGQWFTNIGRPASIEYHKQCVQRLDTVAAYHKQDPSTPVAWGMQWAHDSTIGNVFAVVEHRRRGLAMAMLVEACSRILAKGDLPQCRVQKQNAISINLFRKLGFSSIGKATVFMH